MRILASQSTDTRGLAVSAGPKAFVSGHMYWTGRLLQPGGHYRGGGSYGGGGSTLARRVAQTRPGVPRPPVLLPDLEHGLPPGRLHGALLGRPGRRPGLAPRPPRRPAPVPHALGLVPSYTCSSARLKKYRPNSKKALIPLCCSCGLGTGGCTRAAR
jgi:hypothetical protein